MIWYNLNQQNSRTVLLILMGTQSPFTLTAGKFVTLCVETFANVRIAINSAHNKCNKIMFFHKKIKLFYNI